MPTELGPDPADPMDRSPPGPVGVRFTTVTAPVRGRRRPGPPRLPGGELGQLGALVERLRADRAVLVGVVVEDDAPHAPALAAGGVEPAVPDVLVGVRVGER